MDKKLEFDEGLLNAVINTFDEGICLLDRAGRILTANASALDLLACGRDGLAALPQDVFVDLLASALTRLFDTGQASLDETGRFPTKNGDPLLVCYRLDPIREQGVVQKALLRFREAHPAAYCDLALHDSRTEMAVVLNTIGDGVIAMDDACVVRLFNPAAEILFGYQSAEVIGNNVNMLMPSPDHDAHDGYVANYLKTGIKKIIGIGREVNGRRKNGTVFPLYLTIGEAHLSGRRLFVGILHDLTSRKRTEARLLTLSRVVEQTSNAVMIANLNDEIEYTNPSFTRLTGYSSGELIGQNVTVLRSSRQSSEQYGWIRKTLLAGAEWREEIQDLKKSGESYWALETLSPMRDGSGKITHFLSIQQSITDQKRAQHALQVSEERFRQVAEMSGEWLWEQDAQGCYLYSSNAVGQILGYTPVEILGRSYLNLLTEEDKAHWTAESPPTPTNCAPFYHLVNRYRHKDGHEVFTESTGEPVFDEAGQLIKWRGVDHDITTRKHYEDALRLRERAIEAASVGINISDARKQNHPNIYVNPALSRMTGYTREELLGQDLSFLLGPDTSPVAAMEIRKALQEGRDCEVILQLYRKEGTPFWNELLISPVRDTSAQFTHFIGVHSDVTERRRAEEERHELEIAKHIQLSLLPKAPLRGAGVQVSGMCLPATHVGGDYFDYFYSGETLNVVIADVSGHSVGAALVMAGVRSALKAETRKLNPMQAHLGAAEILSELNELLYEDLDGSGLFISMFYLRYTPSLRHLCYANAGHNRPLILRRNQSSCEELDAEGMILGIKKKVDFEQRCMKLEKGDRVLLYTDGITEAQDKSGEFFGVGGLCQVFSSQREESPESTIDTLLETLRRFCGGHVFNDDVSMVVLKVE